MPASPPSVRSPDGIGADRVLECVGTKESMDQALRSARPGGMVGFVGVPNGGPELPIRAMFNRNVGVNGGVAPVRGYVDELLPDVRSGAIEPGLVFDLELPLDGGRRGVRGDGRAPRDQGAAAAVTDARAALEGRRAEAVQRIAQLDGVLAGLRFDRGADSADDEHDPEGATLSGEWSRLEGLRADAQRELAEVDAAIARVSEGSYGVCVDCGRRIPAARLAVRPDATRCVACAEKAGA